ncbi:MAG TPA: PIN domain-containing protein, partial [Thermoanaerobaculia bacterium]|nr:PIN domain-containing protein [Thermoanaerobaculia bacterium]
MVLPIASEVTDRARELLDDDAELTARDALHAAAVQVYEAQALVSFDRDFDRLESVERREPG